MKCYKIKLFTFFLAFCFLFSSCTAQPTATPQEKLTQNAEAIIPIVFDFPNEEFQQAQLEMEAILAKIAENPELADSYFVDPSAGIPIASWEQVLREELAPYCTEDGLQSFVYFYYESGMPLALTNYYTEIKDYQLEDYSDRQVKITVVLELYETGNSEVINVYTMEAVVQYVDDSGLINHFRLLPTGEKAMMQLRADTEENYYLPGEYPDSSS